MRYGFLPFALMLVPGTLAAQTLGIPPGCQAFLTVQHASCRVAHHITCANDAPGVRHRVDVYPDGLDHISTADGDGQWLGSFDAYSGTSDQPQGVPVNSASFDALLRGSDSYDFQMISSTGEVIRYFGTDTLTGETVDIDGEPLLVLSVDMRAVGADGVEQWALTGTGYAHAAWRMGFSGTHNWVVPGDAYTTEDSPVTFSEPGEPGFLSTVAAYGCAS